MGFPEAVFCERLRNPDQLDGRACFFLPEVARRETDRETSATSGLRAARRPRSLLEWTTSGD